MQNTIVFSTSMTSATILDGLQSSPGFHEDDIKGILDDDPAKLHEDFYGYRVIGSFSDIYSVKAELGLTHFVIGLADQRHMLIREYIFDKCESLGLTPLSSIHARSYISPNAVVQAGAFILPFVSIAPHTHVGCNASLHASVSILEDCTLGNNVLIAGNSFVGGQCVIEDNVYIGPGCTIGSGVKIGRNTVVGGGSLVLKDIPENSFAKGSPISSTVSNTMYIRPTEI